MNAFPCFIRVRLLIAHFLHPCNICPISRNKVGKIRFFCIFIGFHLQIPLLSRIMKQDYIGVVGRAA